VLPRLGNLIRHDGITGLSRDLSTVPRLDLLAGPDLR
jgi:hypothetical protein